MQSNLNLNGLRRNKGGKKNKRERNRVSLISGYLQALFPEVMRPESEADHSPSPEVKNMWSYTSFLPYIFVA